MCGIIGVSGSQSAAQETFLGLTTLQHRGQDAAGILTHDQNGFHIVKNLGLVESVFNSQNMSSLTGALALGHTRYATIGSGDVADVQPFVFPHPFGFGIVHNGNIVNVDEARADLKSNYRRHLLTHSDTEIVQHYFSQGLVQFAHLDQLDFNQISIAVRLIYEKLVGSYSIVGMLADHGLFAFRDPFGNRPLVWGKRKNSDGTQAHMFASESVALEFQGYTLYRDVKPGEIVFVDKSGQEYSQIIEAQPPRHCMFEWVYFSSPESIVDNSPVYGARIKLGRALATKIKNKLFPDVVVPVPETSRIAAIALSEELGVPYRELLIKNRYIKRTFILDSQEKRQMAVDLKLSPVRSEIKGKKVLLVDDSIVRGTTSKKIIELIRRAGAKEVYFVSTCPPIRFPCFYGIDFPEESELIAFDRSVQEMEKFLGADAIVFQDLEGLDRSLEKGSSLCRACLDGKYLTDVSRTGQRLTSERRQHRQKKKETR